MANWPFDLTSRLLSVQGWSILAYLDPGTGSFALQMFLATLFGSLFVLKQFWSGLKGWFFLRFGRRQG